MATMGRYCKAYLLEQLQEFPKWSVDAGKAREDEVEIDGVLSVQPRELAADSVVYLQENHAVTDGIYIDENVIFADDSKEWVEFCKNRLDFSIPDYVDAAERAAEEVVATANAEADAQAEAASDEHAAAADGDADAAPKSARSKKRSSKKKAASKRKTSKKTGAKSGTTEAPAKAKTAKKKAS